MEGHLVGLLHVAACEESVDELKKLFNTNPKLKDSINVKDQSGWTPLHCAASVLHLKEVKFLLSKGADPTLLNNEGSSCLHYLAKSSNPNPESLFKQILKDILKKGALINAVNRNLETPLHIACMKSCVLAVSVFLKDKKCDVNCRNDLGETPLHYSIRTGNKKIIKLLLDVGADPFIEGNKSGNAVQLAEQENQIEIIQLIKTSKTFKKREKELQSSGSSNTLPTIDNSPKTNVAFGIMRGKCVDTGCDCDKYATTQNSDGGPCMNCGHYPAQHEKLGKVGESTENITSQTSALTISNNDSSSLELKSSLSGSTDLKQKKESKDQSSHSETPTSNNTNDTTEGGFTFTGLSFDWSIQDHNELIFEKQISEGTAAKVFKGKFRGQIVAIKVLKQQMDKNQLSDFQKEFNIYRELRSKHVVLFFGAMLKPELCMVFEFCEKGSLANVLQSKDKLDWKRILRLSLDTCKAIGTLHSWNPPIVHRDLKSLNLLVDENYTVKVTDFGLSRFTEGKQSNVTTLGKLRGTYAYSAPELYFGEQFTTRADVYSVGVIFWELAYRCITGEYVMPYSEFPEFVFDFQIIIQVAKNSKRPTIPPSCPEAFKNVIVKCWAQKQQDRPEISEVEEDVVKLYNSYKSNKEEWDKSIVFNKN
eukprot:TRINITY_DN1402_c0_g1_i1.p1 TRINITY_DN1402_c0_g1~~TRINITY_DN1402_c0_g1_i1.p1  ORF type:complete len:648 (+),score=184.50 TRINITY_DN1402_c0_g1_i1:149-2092(+)